MLYFNQNIVFLRKKRKLKQYELADRIGFNRTTWNGYEVGKSFPKFEDLVKISEFFNIPEGDLIHTDLSKAEILSEREEIKDIRSSITEEDTSTNYCIPDYFKTIMQTMQQTIDSHADNITTLKKLIEVKDKEINLLRTEMQTLSNKLY